MPDQIVRKLSCAGVAILVFFAGRIASAATLNEGTVSASTDGQTPVTETFSSVPYVTPAVSMSAEDDASSTTTPDATGLVFKGTFTQSVDENTSSTAGAFQVNFNANAGDTYSLFGSETPTLGTGTLSVSLFDNTTSTSIYSYSNSGTVLVTADGTGGPTAGTLASGDYTFTLDSSMSAPDLFSETVTPDAVITATLAGSGGITLVSNVLPEPTMPVVMAIGAATLLIWRRPRRGVATAERFAPARQG
jgi:hypothetical protein